MTITKYDARMTARRTKRPGDPCPWAKNELSRDHDTEWGVPLHDDRGCFLVSDLEVL